jgi:hypothetical protein
MSALLFELLILLAKDDRDEAMVNREQLMALTCGRF